MLGTDYEEKHLYEVFERNAKNNIIIHPDNISKADEVQSSTQEAGSKSPIITTKHIQQAMANTPTLQPGMPHTTDANLPTEITRRSNLRLVTDLQTCVKAQANYYYARKVRISNLQKMAETVAYAQEHNFDSNNDVEKAHDEALRELRSTRKELELFTMCKFLTFFQFLVMLKVVGYNCDVKSYAHHTSYKGGI